MTGPQFLVTPPEQITILRRNRAGFHVPYFVADQHTRNPDFRVAGRPQFRAAVRGNLCWVCGLRRPGSADAFTIGPMCAVNRVSAEPPAHPECAEYSVQVCPFLSNPAMRRREAGLPPDAADSMAGMPILRNPGVTLIWTTNRWTLSKIHNGWIFDLGDPLSVSWWAGGRPATREQALTAIDAGMPTLREACFDERDHHDLENAYREALKVLPDT